MKALPKKLLPLILFGIAVTSLFSVQPAQAYTVTLQQVGSNVVATGSGPINLTGLTFAQSGQVIGGEFIQLFAGRIQTGATGLTKFDLYRGLVTGPTSFGSGLAASASSGSGDFVGIQVFNFDGVGPNGILFVPQGYVSGAALSDSMTFNNATFASLGVIPGTYVWTWGTGDRTRTSRFISEGLGSRWRLDSFSARLRFAWLDCLAAQIGLLRFWYFVEASLGSRCLRRLAN